MMNPPNPPSGALSQDVVDQLKNIWGPTQSVFNSGGSMAPQQVDGNWYMPVYTTPSSSDEGYQPPQLTSYRQVSGDAPQKGEANNFYDPSGQYQTNGVYSEGTGLLDPEAISAISMMLPMFGGIAGLLGSGAAGGIGGLGLVSSTTPMTDLAINALGSGALSQLSGGNFAQGALTSGLNGALSSAMPSGLSSAAPMVTNQLVKRLS